MDLIKKFLILLAIFCVIGSAVAVSAADVGGDVYSDGTDDGLTDKPIIDPDYAHMEPGSNQTDNATDNATGDAAGEPAANETANVTVNAATSHNMPATGNPILALLAVGAVLGGYGIIRRK